MKAVHKNTNTQVAIKVAYRESERTMPSQIPDIRLLEKIRDIDDGSDKHIVKYIQFFEDE